jgi:hypothetical protein
MNDAVAIGRLTERLSLPISFVPRAAPIPADVRIVWRLPLLLLTLAAVRGGRASWKQLHVLSSGVRTESGGTRLEAALDNERPPDEPVARFEPGLSATVSLAVGLNLARWDRGRRLELTAAGERAVVELKQQGVFAAQEDFLQRVASRVSMTAANRLLGK